MFIGAPQRRSRLPAHKNGLNRQGRPNQSADVADGRRLKLWTEGVTNFTPQSRGLSDQLVDFFAKRVTQPADGFDVQQLEKCRNPREACRLEDEVIRWAK
jgi:hypothetical protein